MPPAHQNDKTISRYIETCRKQQRLNKASRPPARPFKNDHTHRPVEIKGLEYLPQLGNELRVQGIQPVGPVHLDIENLVFLLKNERLIVGFHDFLPLHFLTLVLDWTTTQAQGLS